MSLPVDRPTDTHAGLDLSAGHEVRLQHALASAMSAGRSPTEVLRLFSDELDEWLPHHHVDVELLTEDGEHFVYLGAAFRDPPYHPNGSDRQPSLWSGFAGGERYSLEGYTIRHVIRSGQAARFDSYSTDPVVLETGNPGELDVMRAGLDHGLQLPLRIGERVFGVMCLGRGAPHGPFDDAEFELGIAIAERVAPFLHAFRVYRFEHELREQVERQRDFLARLNAISRAVAGSVDEQAVLETFASELRKAIPCTAIDVRLLIDDEPAEPACRAFVAGEDGRWRFSGKRPVASEPGRGVLLGEAPSELQPLDGDGDAVVLTVPLSARSRLIGALSFTGDRALDGDEQRRVAALFADHLGPYLDSVRMARAAEDRGREVGASAERNRVAQEIHDSIVQDLIAARHALGGGDEAHARGLLGEAIAQSRKLLWSLRTLEVPQQQLGPLLEAEASAAARELGADLDVAVALGSVMLDAGQSTAAYSIVKQLLTNVRRHSHAKAIVLRVTSGERTCHVRLTDDGVGMPPGLREHRPRMDGGGAGLFLVRERVRAAGGTLLIRSDHGKGTVVEVELPLRRPAEGGAALSAAYAEIEPIAIEPASEEPISVLLIDDHQVVREGLRRVLDRTPGLVVVGEAADGIAGVRLAVAARPDVAVVDLNLPHLSGVEVIRAIVEQSPETRILGTSAFDDPQAMHEVLSAGAHAFISKAAPSGDLIRTLRALFERTGDGCVGSVAQVGVRGGSAAAAEQPQLTGREEEILDLIKTDLTYRAIGAQLFISEKTVQYHVNHLFAKLGVRSRAAAVSRASELGFFA